MNILQLYLWSSNTDDEYLHNSFLRYKYRQNVIHFVVLIIKIIIVIFEFSSTEPDQPCIGRL